MALPRYVYNLTGRLRARPKWFGRHVLQVEVREDTMSWPCPPAPARDSSGPRTIPQTVTNSKTFWRDATWEELFGRNIVFENTLA